jgi:hypothetical protein
VSFLRELVRFGGMFQGLPGKFVCGLMVLFVMMCGGSAMCMRGKIVKLRGPLVRVIWHNVSPERYSKQRCERPSCRMIGGITH